MTDNTLPRSAPEAQGIPSAAVLAFLDTIASNNLELHSLMLLRHGHVVAEGWWHPYAADIPHMLFSLTKSFTSTACGFAVTEGRLTVDDPVVSFFPDLLPKRVSKNLAAMRVRDLLTMTTGHAVEPAPDRDKGDWTRAFLAAPVKYKPGTHFLYNSQASNVISAIIQRLTGERLVDYLRPRLFEPLGIPAPEWEMTPDGICTGGWGLFLRTEDIARFGQTLLQGGMWQGRQVIPAGWVAEATARQVPNGTDPMSDWAQGYGYQYWRCRHNAFRGDGAFGQYCIVMPEQDMVMAMTSGAGNMQAVLDAVWEHILPAAEDGARPADPWAGGQLRERLAGLILAAPSGLPKPPLAAQVSGRCYVLPDNTDGLHALAFDFSDPQPVLTLEDATKAYPVTVGEGEWVRGMAPALRGMVIPVAAAGAWTAADTFLVQLRYYGTPFSRTLTCRFDGDTVTVDAKLNVNFGLLEQPQLVGRAEN
jgi:CubicO group peptidase (beta-lactamase class C family)